MTSSIPFSFEAPPTVLVVDDDRNLLNLLKRTLETAGYSVRTAASAEEGLDALHKWGLPHLAIVDIHMPGDMGGLEFCQAALGFSDLPIIMLTADDDRDTETHFITHFAEDYIVKPYEAEVLKARVRRVLMRVGDFSYTQGPVVTVDDYLQIDFPNQKLFASGYEETLSPIETKLLYILLRNSGRTVTKSFCLRRIWGVADVNDERLGIYIHRLRIKIGKKYIENVRGVGYRFVTR